MQIACTTGLNLFRQLAVYLAPVLPRLAQQAGELFGDPIISWEQSQKPLLGTPVGKFTHMMQRVDPKRVEAMLAAGAEPADAETTAETVPFDTDAPLLAEPIAETISFDQFAQVDLRVARVIAAEDVPGAQKLLKLTLGLGGDNHRTVLAGIKGVYKPEDLVGRLVICAANLAPRKMKFGTSEGMIVAAGGGGGEIYLLAPDPARNRDNGCISCGCGGKQPRHVRSRSGGSQPNLWQRRTPRRGAARRQSPGGTGDVRGGGGPFGLGQDDPAARSRRGRAAHQRPRAAGRPRHRRAWTTTNARCSAGSGWGSSFKRSI